MATIHFSSKIYHGQSPIPCIFFKPVGLIWSCLSLNTKFYYTSHPVIFLTSIFYFLGNICIYIYTHKYITFYSNLCTRSNTNDEISFPVCLYIYTHIHIQCNFNVRSIIPLYPAVFTADSCLIINPPYFLKYII